MTVRMFFQPIYAIGLVTTGPKGEERALGTCFAFRNENTLLTAAHCAPAGITLDVHLPPRHSMKVDRVERHPTADVAALEVSLEAITAAAESAGLEEYPDRAFWDFDDVGQLGEEFMTFGFPTEGPGNLNSSVAEEPIPRLFIGHYQRFFDYRAPGRFRYFAGEMSVPAPLGLSGAPVFRRNHHKRVTGLVTTNTESSTTTDSVEEIDAAGVPTRIVTRRLISYGTVLVLSGVADWLDAEVPRSQAR